MARFEITIENEQPLSFLELREIIAIVDGYVVEYLIPDYNMDYSLARRRGARVFGWPRFRSFN